jgi:hypothetical protein
MEGQSAWGRGEGMSVVPGGSDVRVDHRRVARVVLSGILLSYAVFAFGIYAVLTAIL